MCRDCQASLVDVESISEEKRQVFDIPPLAIIVMEHQAETRIFACCGAKNRRAFPKGVKTFTQYGECVKALAAYFLHQHLIPFERVSQIFEDTFNIPLSPVTCV